MSDGLFVRVMDCFAAVEWLLWVFLVVVTVIDFTWAYALIAVVALGWPLYGTHLAVKARR